MPNGDINVMADLWGPVDTHPASLWYFGAEKGTNNTGELEGMGQGLLYLRDFDGTEDAAVFLYDSMYAANMVQGFSEPKSSVTMIRRIQALLADVREGRSLLGKPRKVYFVHVKSHQDDAKGAATDSNVLGNIRADTLVQWGKEDGPYSRLRDGGADGGRRSGRTSEGDGLHGPSPRWEAERQKLVDRTAADEATAREDLVARGEQGDSADTDAETGAKTDEEMLAEQDLLAAMEEAEDIGRAELQSLHGDAAPPTSVVDGVERRRVETGSRPWRTERVGFGELSGGAGTAVYRDGRPEEAATRAARTELGASHAGGPAEVPDVEVQEQNADDSADSNSYSTESRVGSRGPTLSKTNTP